MAQRILGMGDVLSLIEKAQQQFDEDEAKELERKLRRNEFTLEDFLGQLQQIRKMGPLPNAARDAARASPASSSRASRSTSASSTASRRSSCR